MPDGALLCAETRLHLARLARNQGTEPIKSLNSGETLDVRGSQRLKAVEFESLGGLRTQNRRTVANLYILFISIFYNSLNIISLYMYSAIGLYMCDIICLYMYSRKSL
jgi:hypothetical protein